MDRNDAPPEPAPPTIEALRAYAGDPTSSFLADPLATTLPGRVAAVWLSIPADEVLATLGLDGFEAVVFGPEERQALRALPGPPRRRSQRFWGRVAAKEAARRLWSMGARGPFNPAALRVEPDSHRRPTFRWADDPGQPAPSVSIAHADGAALAIVAEGPEDRPGIDVEEIAPRRARLEELALLPGERAWLDRLAPREVCEPSRWAWFSRFWCAKEALGKATGRGLIVGPSSVEVVEVEPETGRMLARAREALTAACPDFGDRPRRVVTNLRGRYAWAWTLGESD